MVLCDLSECHCHNSTVVASVFDLSLSIKPRKAVMRKVKAKAVLFTVTACKALPVCTQVAARSTAPELV